MVRLICAALLLALASVPARAAGSVNVLYAGSLVKLMEQGVGPAFEKASGVTFRGYAGGSNKVANEIKGKLRRGDVFVSANPKVNATLTGAANGDWVRWYVTFAKSPVVIGYNPHGRFAADFKAKRWDTVLQEKGFRLGRTDPKLDPKGRLTLQVMKRAEGFYHEPGLAAKVLGDPENSPQVLPEEALVGRLQSGELDAGFFYSTETADAKIPALTLPPEVTLEATYTVTILDHAPDPAAAERFVAFLLGSEGRALLKEHGLDLVKPAVSGDAAAVPKPIDAVLAAP